MCTCPTTSIPGHEGDLASDGGQDADVVDGADGVLIHVLAGPQDKVVEEDAPHQQVDDLRLVIIGNA